MTHAQNGCVAAIGNFDGVHTGHKALLAQARMHADALGLPLVALTFEPHPRQFFKPDDAPFRLTSAAQKERLLKGAGVTTITALPFNAELAGLSAKDFIDQIVVGQLGARHVVVGMDFHFGKGRSGHLDTLEADGRFGVTGVVLTFDTLAPISSTRVRQALKSGDLEAAATMLGRPFAIEGIVQKGDQRGRTLGYPTLNIDLGGMIAPAYGVYAVRVCVDGVWHNGVANLGIRPMFVLQKPLLEAHIFDFDADLYGQTVEVALIKRLRGEAAFDGLPALIQQMDMDSAAAKALLATWPLSH